MDLNDFQKLREMLREECFDVEEIVLNEDSLPYDNRLQGDGEVLPVGNIKRKWFKRG